MRYKSRAPLTEDEKQMIIDYYLFPHNLRPTADKFNRGIPTIKAVLAERNIQLHDSVTKHICELQASKTTCKEKYSKEFTFQTENNIQKSKQTKLEKYGNANWNNTEKAKQTCLAKYGVENYMQTKEYLIKQKRTCIKKYGAKSYIESADYKRRLSEILEKQKQTNQARYNVDWFAQSSVGKALISEKTAKAIYAKYGVKAYSQTDSWKQSVRQTIRLRTEEQRIEIIRKTQLTNLTKYGCAHPCTGHFFADGFTFDSFPELCFWLYHRTMGDLIKREPKCFIYLYADKKYQYFPDFELNGQLIEIKGDQFIEKSGVWHNPFDTKQDGRYAAKYACAISNNVKIIRSEEYQIYIDWFNQQKFIKKDFILKG